MKKTEKITTIDVFPEDSKKLGKIKEKLGLRSKAWVIRKILEIFDKLKLWKELE